MTDVPVAKSIFIVWYDSGCTEHPRASDAMKFVNQAVDGITTNRPLLKFQKMQMQQVPDGKWQEFKARWFPQWLQWLCPVRPIWEATVTMVYAGDDGQTQ